MTHPWRRDRYQKDVARDRRRTPPVDVVKREVRLDREELKELGIVLPFDTALILDRHQEY